jgi:hypothetical protein
VPLKDAAQIMRRSQDELASQAARGFVDYRWEGASLYARPALVTVAAVRHDGD